MHFTSVLLFYSCSGFPQFSGARFCWRSRWHVSDALLNASVFHLPVCGTITWSCNATNEFTNRLDVGAVQSVNQCWFFSVALLFFVTCAYFVWCSLTRFECFITFSQGYKLVVHIRGLFKAEKQDSLLILTQVSSCTAFYLDGGKSGEILSLVFLCWLDN